MSFIPNSFKNAATNSSLRESMNISLPAITCTVNSTSTDIQKEIVAASYAFLETGENEKLLEVLAVAKESKYTFPKNGINCDSYVQDTRSEFQYRLFIKFLDDKNNIKLRCSIKYGSFTLGSITNSPSSLLSKRFPQLCQSIKEIEKAYKQL